MALLHAQGKWKSVELPAEFLTQEKADELQYLASFEEIDSYDFLSGASQLRKLEQKKKKSETDKLKKKKKKKKVIKQETGDLKSLQATNENVADAFNSQKQPDKKSKSKKRKGQVETPKQEELLKTDSEVEEEEPPRKKKKKSKSIASNPEVIAETSKCAQDDKGGCKAKKHPKPTGEYSSSMKEWEYLMVSPPVIQALDDLGYRKPTPIQQKTLLPAIRDKLDILGAAETGSGKTLAFGIPIVEGLLSLNDKSKCLRALILTPTRELAIQVKGHILEILKYTGIQITSIVGGLSEQKQERILKTKPEIIVGTPGRVWGFLERASDDDYLSNLEGLKYLVIDETDRMVEKGHYEELAHILAAVQKNKSRHKRQTFVFSATLTFVHPAPTRPGQKIQQMSPQDKIDNLVAMTGLRKERKVIDITQSYGTAQSLTEARINCESLMDKDVSLYYFLVKYPGRTLVFTNSIDGSRRLYRILGKCQLSPFLLHAKMLQKQRLMNLEKFTSSSNGILLATDVAARGLDIKGIQHVVHYQVPKTAEVYVHRSGRTARASEKGLSVMLIDPTDAQYYRRICKNLNREEDLPVFPVSEKLFNRLKERIKLATEWESLEHRIKKSTTTESWFEKQARAAEMEFDPSSMGISTEQNEEERRSMQKRIQVVRQKLVLELKMSLPSENIAMTRYPTHENVLKSREVVSKDAEKSLSEAAEERAKIKPALVKGAVKMMERRNKNKKKKKMKRKK